MDTDKIAGLFNEAMNGLNKFQDQYVSEYLTNLPIKVAEGLKIARKGIERKLILKESEKEKLKFLLGEQEQVLKLIDLNKLNRRFNKPPFQSNDDLGFMMSFYKTLPSSSIDEVYQYQLNREVYIFLEEEASKAENFITGCRKSEVKPVIIADSDNLLKVEGENKTSSKLPKGRKEPIKELTFFDLFPNNKDYPKKLIKALKKEGIINEDGKWIGKLSSEKQEVVALAKALVMKNIMFDHSSRTLHKAFTSQFQIQMSDKLFRGEPNKSHLNYYKELVVNCY
ncbi:hypothetical protein EON78_06060 [bacterium]|nr:MAG: hypothetical protein EON78_06060 [bacterium]